MMKPMEQMGSVPQKGVNPMGGAPPRLQMPTAQQPQQPQDPRQEFGLTDEDLDFFRNDPEIKQAVQMFTGRDFPMDQIDDHLLVLIAGMVQKLGVQGAVAEGQRLIPDEQKAIIRGIAMKGGVPRIGGQ